MKRESIGEMKCQKPIETEMGRMEILSGWDEYLCTAAKRVINGSRCDVDAISPSLRTNME
jgi:hypothetical protein